MQVWGDIQQQAQKTSKGVHRNAIPSIGGPTKAFKAILKKEGPKGMFRGLGATLVTVPLFWGVYFPLYDETKDVLTHRQQFVDVSEYHPGVVHCLSAIMTGAVADVICNPFFVVRTRLQTEALHELTAVPAQAPAGTAVAASMIANNSTTTTTTTSKGNQQNRISMLQMARRLKEQHGMPVFWRGMTANLIGLSHCAVQFPAYEYLKGYLRNERENKNGNRNNFNSFDNNNNNNNTDNTDNTVTELLIASGLAKMTASLLSYPHEVLRSRMVDSRSSKSPTLIGTAQQILRREGIVGFYNGRGVTLVRVIPNCCVTFLSYELILKHSKEYFRE
jgi:solute carrier family 25 folate transporter 32